MERATNEIRM